MAYQVRSKTQKKGSTIVILLPILRLLPQIYLRPALMWASCRGHDQTVKHLLAAKADVNKIARRVIVVQSVKFVSPSKMVSRTTSLLLAATHGYATVVEQLVKAGANLEVVGIGNAPPVHEDGNESSVGPAVGGTGEGTALFFAARNNHLKVTEILLNHGAMVDSLSRSQETALHKVGAHTYEHRPFLVTIVIPL